MALSHPKIDYHAKNDNGEILNIFYALVKAHILHLERG